MKRTCACCKETIDIDKHNSNKAICYKDRFYHFDCFVTLCEQKIQSRRASPMWAEAKANIDNLVSETTKNQRELVAKDDLNFWILSHYNISFLGKTFYMKLNDIYNGTYKGLAYAISPMELLEEWQYFWKDLCATRAKRGIDGDGAVNYDLVILLSKNAEYRNIKRREQLAREVNNQQREQTTMVDLSAIKSTKNQKRKISDLYQEMNGGENDE